MGIDVKHFNTVKNLFVREILFYLFTNRIMSFSIYINIQSALLYKILVSRETCDKLDRVIASSKKI